MKTRFLLYVLFILCFTLLCALGFWQLSRAQAKRALIQQAEAAKTTQILDNQSLLNNPMPKRFQHVKFSTNLMNENIILLDNQVHKGQVGYHVLVPAHLDDENVILINRGFIPLGKNRQELPMISPISSTITIEGYLDIAYRNPLTKQVIENSIHWPLRVQQIDFDFLNTLMNVTLYPMLVTLNEDSPYALSPLPMGVLYLTPERHIGYAVQWFSLAITLFIWFSYFLYKRKHKNHDHTKS